jgi:hypothetical protein
MGILDRFLFKPTLAQFGTAVANRIRSEGVRPAISFDPAARQLRVDDGKHVALIALGSAYDEFLRARDDATRVKIIDRCAAISVAPRAKSGAELSQQQLLKVTPQRERQAIQHLAKKITGGGATGGLLEGIAITDQLYLELAIDEPELIRTITEHDLEAANLTEAQAIACATRNLADRSRKPLRQAVPGLFVSDWNDDFDAARLALPSLFDGLGLRGDLVVAIPRRSILLITASDEPKGLAALYMAIRQCHAEIDDERPVQGAPLRRRSGRWHVLGSEDTDVASVAPELLFLSAIQDALDYAAVGEAVRQDLAARGMSVEPLHLVDDGDAPPMTLTRLGGATPTVIPRANVVLYSKSDGTSIVLAWHKVVAMLADDLSPMDVWPPHYLVARGGKVAPPVRLSDASRPPHFDEVLALIERARHRAYQAVNTQLVDLYWQLSEYISKKIASAEWGDGVVDDLATTIARRYPGMRGYTRPNLFRMRLTTARRSTRRARPWACGPKARGCDSGLRSFSATRARPIVQAGPGPIFWQSRPGPAARRGAAR